MKKILLASALVLAIAVSAAVAQEVLSQNAVGYIKKTIPAGGKLVAMSIPLNNMNEGTIVFGRTSVAQEAPPNSYVYFWNPTSQAWEGGIKSPAGGGRWGPLQSNYVVQAGEGFFLKSPATSTEDIEVTITGEVPAEATLARAIPGGGALGTMGNPYPVDFTFGKSDLALNATPNSYVYFWNPTNQAWQGGIKSPAGGGRWGPLQSNYVVQAGEGFFLKEAATVNQWVPERPYSWPN
jgi:hypothetical protein